MKTSSRKATLTAAIAADCRDRDCGEASAEIYAGSKLEISNLTLAITGATAGGITGYTFNLDNTARLNGVSGRLRASVRSVTRVGCPLCAASPASPFTAVAANAPGSTIQRVDGSVAQTSASWARTARIRISNSDSEILTAQLVDGVPSSTVQITEAQFQGNGPRKRDERAVEHTVHVHVQSPPLGVRLVLDFDANPALFVAINTLI